MTLSGALAANLLFQDLRMDAGRTVIGGVLSVDLAGGPFERLLVAAKSRSAGSEPTPPPSPTPPPPNDTQDVSSAPDLSTWGLIAMILAARRT